MADQSLDILVRVTGGSQASAEIQSIAKSTGNVGEQAQTASKKTSGLRSTLGTLATGFAVYKGYQYIKSAVDETTSLARATSSLSRITGMDSQTASAWVQIGKERGIQSKQLNQGFIALSKQISSAQAGSKSAAASFTALGISQKDLAGLSTQQAIARISDGLAKLPNGADKAALASKLFGRSAQGLLPILNGGSKGLADQITEMQKHLGMSQQSEKQALQLAAQQRQLSATMVGVKVAIATALLPILAALTSAFLPIIQAFAALMTHSGAFRVAVVALTGALVTLIATLKIIDLLGLEFDATWGLIPALVVGVALALILLYNKCAWFRNAVQGVMAAVAAAFGWVRTAAGAVVSWVSGHWQLLAGLLFGPIGIAVAEIISHFKQITSVASSVFGAITSAVKAVASVITGTLGGAFSAVKSVIDSLLGSINSVVSAASKVTSIPGKLGSFASSLNPFAAGGTVAPGGEMALVGERGPEIVSLPGGSHVIPNHQIGAVASVHHVTIPVSLDGHQVGKAFGSYVAGQQARR